MTERTLRWVAAAALTALSSLIWRPARAGEMNLPEYGVSLGPTIAYAHAPELGSGLVYGFDAAYFYTLVWGGAGVRLFETLELDERKVLPYAEIGLWLFLNVGGGYTLDASGGEASGPHFFVGLPLPFSARQRQFLLAEPYYRATYADVGTVHEVGAFVKWCGWK